VDEKLDEIDNGRWEKLTEAEIRRQYPDLWSRHVGRSEDFRFPGGETGEEALMRAKAFLLQATYDQGNIVAVSHDGLIRCLMCHLLAIPVYSRALFKVDIAGITEIEYTGPSGSWRLIRFNQKVFW
jgi:broad specificity phosphatase PhoE